MPSIILKERQYQRFIENAKQFIDIPSILLDTKWSIEFYLFI